MRSTCCSLDLPNLEAVVCTSGEGTVGERAGTTVTAAGNGCGPATCPLVESIGLFVTRNQAVVSKPLEWDRYNGVLLT
jgi:hypothetical protein